MHYSGKVDKRIRSDERGTKLNTDCAFEIETEFEDVGFILRSNEVVVLITGCKFQGRN